MLPKKLVPSLDDSDSNIAVRRSQMSRCRCEAEGLWPSRRKLALRLHSAIAGLATLGGTVTNGSSPGSNIGYSRCTNNSSGLNIASDSHRQRYLTLGGKAKPDGLATRKNDKPGLQVASTKQRRAATTRRTQHDVPSLPRSLCRNESLATSSTASATAVASPAVVVVPVQIAGVGCCHMSGCREKTLSSLPETVGPVCPASSIRNRVESPSGPAQTTSSSKTPSSDSFRSSQKSNQTSPNSNQTSPNSNQTSPNSNQTSPNSNQTSPNRLVGPVPTSGCPEVSRLIPTSTISQASSQGRANQNDAAAVVVCRPSLSENPVTPSISDQAAQEAITRSQPPGERILCSNCCIAGSNSSMSVAPRDNLARGDVPAAPVVDPATESNWSASKIAAATACVAMPVAIGLLLCTCCGVNGCCCASSRKAVDSAKTREGRWFSREEVEAEFHETTSRTHAA